MPGGRPSPIDAVVGHDRDGNPITVADRIVNGLRVGQYFEHACAQAGITKETGYAWLRTAGRLRLRARGEPVERIRPKPTGFELRCVAFSDAVATAESSWEVGALALLEQLGRGGLQTVKTVIKRDGIGEGAKVLESTTTTETLPPNAQVIEWRLTRRFPGRYGPRIEVVDPERDPLVLSPEERVEHVAETLEAYLQGVDDARPKRRRRARPAAIEAVSRPRAVTDGTDPPGSPGA